MADLSTFELDNGGISVYFICIMETLALIKFLAQYGGVSRREADAAIRAGRVTVDGEAVLRPEHRLSGSEEVCFDGKKVESCEREHVYIMLNKPVNYTCSANDSHAEHLAVELIDVQERIFSAGRLDRDSEGLIIFSDDGVFIDRLTHPRYGIKKLYHVTVNGTFTAKELEKMCSGVRDEDGDIKALEVKSIGSNIYSFLLNEGKKREIRRLVKAMGKRVKRLVRVRQGALELGDLAPGKWRYLTADEVKKVQENVE